MFTKIHIEGNKKKASFLCRFLWWGAVNPGNIKAWTFVQKADSIATTSINVVFLFDTFRTLSAASVLIVD
jgi:hypothetical protein